MATVTVLGASGTITVPFKSTVNATFAQQLAAQISTAVTNNPLAQQPFNSAPAATSPSELAVGGFTPTSLGGGSYTLNNEYVAVVTNSTSPVTITAGSAPVAPLTVLGGEGSTTFFSGTSTIGGAIALGGGVNTISGSAPNGLLTSANGGLQGSWTISAGSGASGGSDDIYLASGADTVHFGGGDSVHAGGASVLGLVDNTDAVDPTFFIGSVSSTVFGLGSPDVAILGNDGATGGGVYVLGTGGNGVIAAGGGNTTLVGGGNGDILFASTAAGAQAVFFAGAGAETLQGSYAGAGGNSTLYGGSGPDVIAASQTNTDVVTAGAGNDTIFSGMGQDSIWFYAPESKAVNDTIYNFDLSTNTLILDGYGLNTYKVTSTGSAPLQITLSDSSTITFENVSTSQIGSLKIAQNG